MPVTFSPAKHLAAESRNVMPVTAAQILQKACPNGFKQVDEIMQCSIGGRSEPANTVFKIIPNTNGFVNTVLSAYSQHHALVIRPDDVWLAIISQFSFYVNGNAELLRATFVGHEGKKELEIFGVRPLDCALLSRQMGELIHKNVVDPALCDWILPNFSTTTTADTTIGSMLMMATMKKYFDYRMTIVCGIPRVTLEGEQQDWEMLLLCLEKLKEYGLETIAWYHLLYPVLSRFAKAFEAPESPKNLYFWQKVARGETLGCGSHEWSGWITAFCVFSAEGRWQGPKLDTNLPQSRAPESMSSRHFWSSYTRPLQEMRPHLTLDRTEYPVISHDDVPAGYAEVDVILDDNGTEYPCVIVAGVVGMGFSSSRDPDVSLSETGKNDQVRPVLAWWMYSKLDEREQNRREELARHEAYTRPAVFIVPYFSSAHETHQGDRRERGQSTPAVPSTSVVVPQPTELTMHWVTAQSHETRWTPAWAAPVPVSESHRRSEHTVRAEQASDPVELPVRKRWTSVLQRLFKF